MFKGYRCELDLINRKSFDITPTVSCSLELFYPGKVHYFIDGEGALITVTLYVVFEFSSTFKSASYKPLRKCKWTVRAKVES